MSELTQIVWFIVLFPVLCTVTIFVTVLAHNKAQDWYYQKYGTVATVDDDTEDYSHEDMEWGDRDMTCEQYYKKGNHSIPAQMEVNGERLMKLEILLDVDTSGGHDPYFADRTDVVTLFKKQIASLSEQIVDAAKLFNKLADEIKEIKSDGYHWNVETRKLSESEERNISRMESTEGDVRRIMSNLNRVNDAVEELQSE